MIWETYSTARHRKQYENRDHHHLGSFSADAFAAARRQCSSCRNAPPCFMPDAGILQSGSRRSCQAARMQSAACVPKPRSSSCAYRHGLARNQCASAVPFGIDESPSQQDHAVGHASIASGAGPFSRLRRPLSSSAPVSQAKRAMALRSAGRLRWSRHRGSAQEGEPSRVDLSPCPEPPRAAAAVSVHGFTQQVKL